MPYTLLFASLLTAGVLYAQSLPAKVSVDFDEPIADDSTTTYGDLIRLICPGLEINSQKPSEATGSDCIAHRVMEAGMDPSTWEGVLFKDLSRIPAKTLGKDRMLVSFEGSDNTRGLGVALFEILPKPKLLDVIETTGAPDCAPSLYYDLPLAGGAEVLGFGSAHGNVGFADEQITLVSVRDNHLEKITSVWLQSCSRTAFGYPGGCEAEKSDVERSLAATSPGGVLQLRVTEKRRATRTYTATYQWDPASKRYRATSDALAGFTGEHR
ncbi:MAG TPA: hypothetical protein VKU19_03055 [Bryobacteraceae bacterium]|nr:hypothetical protein [Bryobacteraceae bacterium]